VRQQGETGSYRDPEWANAIQDLGSQLDAAVSATVDERTLADLLNQAEP